jgi:hypothetical protein
MYSTLQNVGGIGAYDFMQNIYCVTHLMKFKEKIIYASMQLITLAKNRIHDSVHYIICTVD